MSDILDEIDEAIEDYVTWHGSGDSASWSADGSHEDDESSTYGYYGTQRIRQPRLCAAEPVVRQPLQSPLDRERAVLYRAFRAVHDHEIVDIHWGWAHDFPNAYRRYWVDVVLLVASGRRLALHYEGVLDHQRDVLRFTPQRANWGDGDYLFPPELPSVVLPIASPLPFRYDGTDEMPAYERVVLRLDQVDIALSVV